MSERKPDVGQVRSKGIGGTSGRLARLLTHFSERLDRQGLLIEKLENKIQSIYDAGRIEVASLTETVDEVQAVVEGTGDFGEGCTLGLKEQIEGLRTGLDNLKKEADRAYTLNGSRAELSQKRTDALFQRTEALLVGMQRFNLRLSLAEGKVSEYGSDIVRLTERVAANPPMVTSERIDLMKAQLGTALECIAALNQRITELAQEIGDLETQELKLVVVREPKRETRHQRQPAFQVTC